MTSVSAVQDATANKSDDSAPHGVQRDHAGQQEGEHDERRAALPGAVNACDKNLADADEKRDGEEHSAGLGEPKPVTEPPPIAAESRHV
jgi:hypothetical protein